MVAHRRPSAAHTTSILAFTLIGLCFFAPIALSTRAVQGQSSDEDEEEPFRSGLIARQTSPGDATSERLVATVQYPLDDAAENGDANRSLQAGAQPRQVAWQGRLWVQVPGAYRLFAFSNGSTTIKLQDKVVLQAESRSPAWHATEELDLPFGYLPLEIDFAPAVATDKSAQTGAPPPQLNLFWSGPQFGLEPIPPRFLVHPRESTPAVDVAAGRRLTRALRCAACHDMGDATSSLAAPALDRVRDSLHPEWTVAHLTAQPIAGGAGTAPLSNSPLARRMPFFALDKQDAADLTAFLFERSLPPQLPNDSPSTDSPSTRSDRKGPTPANASNKSQGKSDKAPVDSTSPTDRGRRLLASVGCLACHRHEGVGTSTPFDGGDLTRLAAKRPEGFVERWLADPASVNRSHRMPLVDLTSAERGDLAKFLETGDFDTTETPIGDPERGATLFENQRCQACHISPDGGSTPAKLTRRFGPKIDWERSCLATSATTTSAPAASGPAASDPKARRPRYALSPAMAQLVRSYVEQIVVPAVTDASVRPRDAAPRGTATERSLGPDWLIENQCLNCHSRNDQGGLNEVAVAVAGKYSELAPVIHGLLPPSLTSVGDKLTDEALAVAIRRSNERRRPWLAVRMPKYGFADKQIQSAVAHFVRSDRIPDAPPAEARAGRVLDESELKLPDAALRTVGGRLVTTDGFGCLSCHAVGPITPPNAPLNQRAPNLSQLATRIRPAWFDRWTRNPARIVPRMEMPSVQLPVRGVLDERLDRQLAAVWHALNRPDFTPPEPNPVQTLRLTGVGHATESAELVTDVLQADGRTHIKPLLIGLPNRHNVLFDVETNRLARWSLGDVARQRTKGKTWFWEAAGVDLLGTHSADSEMQLELAGRRLAPHVATQFPTELDEWRHIPGGLEFSHRLQFAARDGGPNEAPLATVHVRQRFVAIDANATAANNGFRRELSVRGIPAGARLLLRVLDAEQLRRATLARDERRWRLDDGTRSITVARSASPLEADGFVAIVDDGARDGARARGEPRAADVVLEYRATLANDQFPPLPVPPLPKPAAQSLDIVPGFTGTRLPLTDQQMPTALAWRANGTLLVASLKGRVWQARDTDGDGLEDQWQAFSDELAAPYGLSSGPLAAMPPAHGKLDPATRQRVAPVDVTTKYAVLRLWDDDGDGRADRTQTIASGWGHTADYHDWTVGLPSDGAGGYYIGLACQQDKRSLAAARLRGTMIHLVPRTPTDDDPRPYRVDLLSAGHRFPMGIAVNRAGDVFVTDNQGNYNPFNELNHVRRGLRYGFINAIEQKPDFRPPAEAPAIEIPHPWTRSVNGICFLDATPVDADEDEDASTASRASAPPRPFGPFTGHLVGCEYDTRRLIRMSLQKVGDTYQGTCYPLTFDERPAGAAEALLLGPICCAVSPSGDLYVGGIRDSGWGGGNNIGEVVRLRFQEDRLPAGIAEVRAVRDGFEIDFTRPVDPARASDPAQYSLSSYRRVSTPAYGGPDVDRRTERIKRVVLSADTRHARLELEERRSGFVYELRLQNLAVDRERFFPAEAYMTVR